LSFLRFSDKIYPFTGLEDGAVGKIIETLPVRGFDIDGMKLHL
jgi:hypothetical protein